MSSILQSNSTTMPKENPGILYQTKLDLDIAVYPEDQISEDDIARSVIKAVEDSGIIARIKENGRRYYGYSSMDMLKAVILAHTLKGSVSLRQMEDLSRNDIRFRLIFKGKDTPSFMAYQRFLNENLKGSLDEVLRELNLYFKRQISGYIDTDSETIDGTKEEADANKMSFVWARASEKYYLSCYKKIDELIQEINACLREEGKIQTFSIVRKYDLAYMIQIADQLCDCMLEKGITLKYGKGSRKSKMQKYYERLKDLALRLWKYEIHFDILQERNSFSKSDPDATFMHMKYDYYNHTGVFKPGYNVQFGNCSGFIWDIYISDDVNDMKTYIPLMEKHYKLYGSYPAATPADAGYGSYDNYCYCKKHGISLYMKYSGYEKKKEKINDENRFKAIHFSKNEEGLPVCPAGFAFRVEKERIETRGIYERKMETLVNDHCEGCPFQKKCTKSKSGNRTISRCKQLEQWKEEVDENLAGSYGQDLMARRAVYSEGFFGDKKYNWNHDRLHHIGSSGVNLEIYLYAYGKNMRRFHQLLTKKKENEKEALKKLTAFVKEHRPSA